MDSNQSELQTYKRQYKVISLQEKLAILRELETGSSRREVELMFNCSQSTISRVLSCKESMKQEAQGNVTSRRDYLINYKELEQALSQWAREMKMSDSMITANMAKQKAVELSRSMGHDWKPSTAWLYKWKEKENIIFSKRTKDPEEILKEFLDKRDKNEVIEKANEEENKRLKIDSAESSLEIKDKQRQQVRQDAQNEKLSDNAQETNNKPRLKREYVKRLPMIDASGVVYRSRKEKTFLTLLQKLEILQRLKNGERRPDLTVEYNLSQSAMSQIITDEEKILKLAACGQNLQMKRIRGGIFKGGEAELNAWVREKMELGECLTRTQIKNHAKEIAERLNIDFKASTGWLEKWKVRMNLDFNENQILQRKIPNYLSNEEEFENGYEYSEQADISYEQQSDNGDLLQQEIKEELTENDYQQDTEIQDELCYDMNETDIKPELLTPQQFYLQTIRADSQTSHRKNVLPVEQGEQLFSEEEPDIKPFVGTSPPLGESETEKQPPAETLHEQVLSWLNRYSIPSVAASELLNILQPHLNATSSLSPRQQKQQYF